ncbi:nicotinate-nucleotide adenylyltransferase [Saccharobesus litoralis]|uniref:Probable nicotinate-nucleotide adenylyltransferase n=1 Tax=Saccharobesus litoralis TaxID=2172099 RepID=A0A2S0VVQ5_9ALTE|nr:nicotinate-nucleotide adenylyltransferase [Saccharobesus litoralis]AWB68288.1 nicotinate-nucleotide adenylyltransferase [Saccharobesus litoralis]
MNKPTLLFGGTFDPIHNGHIQPILEIQEWLGADEIRLIPNRIPPHKARPETQDQHRVAMCQQVAAMYPQFVVDDIELTAPRISYSFDTFVELRQRYTTTPLCFVIGMDSLNSIHTWHRWQELLDYVHLVVAERGGYQTELHPDVQLWLAKNQTESYKCLENNLSGKILLVNSTKLKISSSYIRQRLSSGLDCRCLLPYAVHEYIEEHHLYLS